MLTSTSSSVQMIYSNDNPEFLMTVYMVVDALVAFMQIDHSYALAAFT